MPEPSESPGLIESLSEVVTDVENLIESLTDAAADWDETGNSPDFSKRLRSWATVLEDPHAHVNRVVQAARGRSQG